MDMRPRYSKSPGVSRTLRQPHWRAQRRERGWAIWTAARVPLLATWLAAGVAGCSAQEAGGVVDSAGPGANAAGSSDARGVSASQFSPASSQQLPESLFVPLSASDSARLPPRRTVLDTFYVNRRPGNRVEMVVVPVPAPAGEREFVRMNFASLDTGRISAAGQRSIPIVLNFLRTQPLRAMVSGRPGDLAGTWVWQGTLEAAASTANQAITLVRAGSAVSGTIRVGETTFTIRPVGAGVHEIERVTPREFPPERQPRRTPSGGGAGGAAARPDSPPLTACAPVVIDVLAVVTPAVTVALGDLDGVRATVQRAAVETDTALAWSDVGHRIRIVDVVQTQYSDEGNIDVDLDRLTGRSDGHLDDVHQVRVDKRADVVSLWVERTDKGQAACGFGHLISDPSAGRERAFFVVRRDCATDPQFSFGHELGHVLGAEHNREDAAGKTALPYAFGYRDPDERFRDIMAYPCANGCGRVQFYSMKAPTAASRSHRVVKGLPLGLDTADVARAVKLTMCQAAQYQ
jgi:hypothetical protein